MEWWRDMFAIPQWQRVQLSWDEADDGDAEAEQIVRALGLTGPGTVLDVPCGSGRIATRLRAMGHDVVGVDGTHAFLAVARDAGLRVIRADMRTSVVRSGSFDAAICVWGSFGYFDEEGNRMHARAMVDALRSGGRCLVDTLVADTLLPRFAADAEWSVGDIDVTEVRHYEATTKRIETRWTFSDGDQRATQLTSVRLYALEELTDLFGGLGCGTFQAYDAELAPFGDTSDRVWLVATKG